MEFTCISSQNEPCEAALDMLSLRPHMATNVQVTKNNNESSANVIRRFTKRMQGAGIVRKVRGQRYFERTKSRNVQKEARLKKLAKKEEYERQFKLGIIQDKRR